MVNIFLPDLDKDTIYAKVLQTVEDICEEYSMESDFGILSMANQEVIDYLLAEYPNFSVDFNCNLHNDEIVFVYDSTTQIFDKLKLFDKNNLLSSFAYKVSYEFDNKQFSFNIHVKPKFSISRNIQKKVSINQIQI